MISSNEVSTLDWSILDELSQYETEEGNLAGELVTLFLDESPRQLMLLQSALHSSDFPQVARCSHQLKGSAGAIGALRLREICESVERNARLNQTELSAIASNEIANELDRLREALKAKPHSSSASSAQLSEVAA